MESVSRWSLTNVEKNKYISMLTPHLPVLRRQAEISQDELANFIGVSRQTYSAVERKVRRMTWSTYFSLVLFFDHNPKTHSMLRTLSAFPEDLIRRFNNGEDYSSYNIGSILGNCCDDIIECLDEKAKRTISSVIMLEYARCTQLSSEAIVRSFDGFDWMNIELDRDNVKAAKALRTIKEKSENEE